MRVVGISKVPSRWDVEKELDKFLSGENTVSVAEMTSEGIVGGGPMAGGGQTGKNLTNFGETSRESGVAAKSPMVVPVALMRAKLHSCPVAKLLAPILVASHPNWEVERQIGDDSRNMDSNSPGSRTRSRSPVTSHRRRESRSPSRSIRSISRSRSASVRSDRSRSIDSRDRD
nr:hypothetical protein CFP56_62073 [Quercus suber]